MKKLLVNLRNGDQALVEVSDGGSYSDLSSVVWDERVDGPMPSVTLGGMVRQGNLLVLDDARLAAALAARRAVARAALAKQIDDAVAAVYARYTRFQIEYESREAQAVAFKAAGYVGEVPPRVAEFAAPAGLTAQVATDLILQQAGQLRLAMGQLSGLRMRKYEVLRAPSDDSAQSAFEFLAASIKAVDSALA